MKLKGIDLFSGIGGFHIAANKNNIDVVFASEIDKRTSYSYLLNFGLDPDKDITKCDEKEIPYHDILMGGFPCQPFSKAGKREGFQDTRGTLFFHIERILRAHKPKFILLENVQSLATHDDGRTWKIMHNILEDIGYQIPSFPLIVSPVSFGTPQIRKRVFIPGIRKEDAKFDKLKINIPAPRKTNISSIIIDKYNEDKTLFLNNYQKKVLKAWTEFKNNFYWREIQHPIWTYEFFEERDISKEPIWKQKWIRRNRDLYINNKIFIDVWYKKWNVHEFRRQDQKFEWNAKNSIKNLSDGIIQFRSSGVRIKTPDVAPTLVAKNDRIIVPGGKRFISVEETALLQDFPKNYKWDSSENIVMKQLGNAVNVKVTDHMIKELLKNEK